MERLTTDQPMGIMQNCLNLFYAKDGEAWVRDGAPGPLHKDIRLFDFIREAIMATVDEERTFVADFSDEELGDVMVDYLSEGNTSIEGLIGTLYTAAWAFAEIRARLKAYEETGLEPDQVDQIRRASEYMMFESVGDFVRYSISNFEALEKYRNAEREGRLVVLPCKVGTPVWWIETVIKSNGPGKWGKVKFIRTDEFCYEMLGWIDTPIYLTREEAEAALNHEVRT